MLEVNIKYQRLQSGHSSIRGAVLRVILSGLRRWDKLMVRGKAEKAHHYKTLGMYPLGTLGKELSKVLETTEQGTLRQTNMHQQILHLFFPVFNQGQMASALPFVLLGNGKIQKRILLLSSFCWLFYPADHPYFKAAFELGKSLNKFTRWDIRHLLHEPTEVIKAMLIKESVGESEAPILW